MISGLGHLRSVFATESLNQVSKLSKNAASVSPRTNFVEDSLGHVVGLAALDMVQHWAELDVAGVGLSSANWMLSFPHDIRPDA